MRGIFLDGSVSGLLYQVGDRYDVLEQGGYFTYEEGEVITFSIGDVMLGSCVAAPVVTPISLVGEADKTVGIASNYMACNMARFLLSLGCVTPEMDSVVRKYSQSFNFCQEPEQFSMSEPVKASLEEMGIALICEDRARNILRRSGKGIRKETDVRVPVGDGRYVLADIYRPLVDGNYPVVMSMGAFGKSFINGFSMN